MSSKLRPVNELLADFIAQAPFRNAHTRQRRESRLDLIAGEKFFKATLDEVRLHYAERFTRSILERFDLDDAMHFHEAVLSRELTGSMTYEKQRDHAAHTLNNYLLGWFFFSHCKKLRDAVGTAIGKRRKWEGEQSLHTRFGNVWVWASLLHDVGYLLEGNVQRVSPEVQHASIVAGARVIQDYFDHRFWFEVSGGSLDLRDELCAKNPAQDLVPRIDGSSIASVATSLSRIPVTKELQEAVAQALRADDKSLPEPLHSDAFRLWHQHFAMYDTKEADATTQMTMANRVDSVRRWFEGVLWDGYPAEGFRILDHGVCSGLILLQFSTFYFSVLEKARQNKASPWSRKWFEDEQDRANVKPRFWWDSVVWGTGAAAVHNIVQVALKYQDDAPAADVQTHRYPEMKKLALDEDPIAYLGLLVDLLQEWDRYSVRRGTYVLSRGRPSTKLPLQSCEVEMGEEADRVVLDVGSEDIAKRIIKDLTLCLTNWEELVEIRPEPQPRRK